MLQLNDFNRAEFRLWDEAAGEYCLHRNGPGHGNWRAPEEYRNDALSEKVDVWSLGNNLYTVLTGATPILDPHRRDESLKFQEFVDLLTNGTTGYIAPHLYTRSEPERVLAELIPRCWAMEPQDRPTVAEIVHELEAAVEMLERQHQTTRQAILQTMQYYSE
jgi:serine/threonine protein kinase